MNGATPARAAANAFVTGCVARGITASAAAVPPEGQLATVRGLWADVAQAVVDAATEGSLRACGYTLADVGRFLEAEAAAQDARPAPELPREKWAEPKRAPGLAAAVDALTNVTESHERVMFAAGIDIRRGEPGAARRLLGEQLGGWDGMPPWNGTETGAQYLERTSGGGSS